MTPVPKPKPQPSECCSAQNAADPNDTCCHTKDLHTDYSANYQAPVVPRRTGVRTRGQHMDRFLWAHLTKAYIERKLAEERQAHSTTGTSSEYAEKFRRVPLDHRLHDEGLQKLYPLYGTAAVTLWAPEVGNRTPFNMVNCLTKPNSECYEQFR